MAAASHHRPMTGPDAELQSRGKPYSLNEFDKHRDIGSGTFGTVSLYRHRKTGTPVVIKSVNKLRTFAMKQQRSVLQERLALMELTESSCPFVVKAYGTTQDHDNIYFITEFVPGGEIYTFMKEYSCLTEDQTRFYCAQLVLALRHMHEKHNIVYRDIKPENVLLDNNGYVKMVDFGFAKKLERRASALSKTFSYVGTPEYMAPELGEQGHAGAVDLWALGIFTYELLTSRTPFQGLTEDCMKKRISQAIVDFPSSFSEPCKDFVHRLLCRDPELRLGCGLEGFAEVIRHPWFAGMDWDALLAKELPAPFVPRVDSVFDTTNYLNEPRTGYVRRISISTELVTRFFAEFNCRISEIPVSECPIGLPMPIHSIPSIESTRSESFQFDEWPEDGDMY